MIRTHSELIKNLAPNAAGDVATIATGLAKIPVNVARTIPREVVSLYREQGLKQGGANFVKALPEATWQALGNIVPESMKTLANWDGTKQIPAEFQALVDTEGSYGKAALSLMKELPDSVPTALRGELDNVSKAIEQFADHPVREGLGWMAIHHLLNSAPAKPPAKAPPAEAPKSTMPTPVNRTTAEQIRFAEESATQYLNDPSVKGMFADGKLPAELFKGRIDDYGAHLNRASPGLGDNFKSYFKDIKGGTIDDLHRITEQAAKLGDIADDLGRSWGTPAIFGAGIGQFLRDLFDGTMTYKAPETEAKTSYKVGDVELSEDDIAALRPLLFAEISNRERDKQALEARTIFEVALNRLTDKDKRWKAESLKDVLEQPKQFQGFTPGEGQYAAYLTPDDQLDEPTRQKKQAVDAIVNNLLNEIKSGQYQNQSPNMYFYTHRRDGTLRATEKEPNYSTIDL